MNNLRILNQELTRRRTPDTYSSELYPALLRSSSSHTPYSNDASGSPTTTLLLECVCECIWKGWVEALLSLERSVPAISKYGNIDNCLGEDKGKSPAKAHLDWCQSRFGRPHLAAFGHRLWPGDWLVGPLLCTSVPGLCMLICSVNWALFVSVTQDWIFCAFVLRLLLISSLFHVWVPVNQESPKLVEMVRNKSYDYFWWLNVMKRCRSWRFYFWLKDHQQHPHT